MTSSSKDSDTARRRQASAVWEVVPEPTVSPKLARKYPGIAPPPPPPTPVPAKLIVVGFAGGVLSTALGIGGGIIMVPLLTIWLRQKLATAAAASVATIIVSSGIGVLAETARTLLDPNLPSNILWGTSLLLGLGAVIGIRLGMVLRERLPERLMAWLFCAVLLLSAAKLAGLFTLFGASNVALLDSIFNGNGEAVPNWVSVPVVVLLGAIGGLSVPLFGLGGGVIYVPGLAILLGAFATAQVARGTSMGAVLINAAYTCILMVRGNALPYKLLMGLAPGSAIGAILGVIAANNLDSELLKIVIAVFIAGGGIRMAMPRNRRKK